MLSNFKTGLNKSEEVDIIDSPYTIRVPECNGTRYAISDIHGCSATFKALVSRLNLTKNDQLFLLGDYIDRGKNSKGVVDEILNLKNSGYNIFPLKGNHEDDLLLLYSIQNKRLISNYLKIVDNNSLFNENYEIDDKYLEFLVKLPYFFELKDFLLVHAGFNFRMPNPYINTDDMLWIRNFSYDAVLAKGKTIVHGHDPREIEEIRKKIAEKNKIIPLDNGCFFDEDKDFGRLLCLNLDTFELITQENVENT
jgi:serine/threonine protein phosphatase 1